MFLDNAMSPADVTVRTSDLLVATPDAADPLVDASVLKALQILRQMLRVDAVFVAELIDGARVTRVGETTGAMPMNVGEVIPLERTYCRLVLEGKLPEFIPDVTRLAEEVAPPDLLPGLRGHGRSVKWFLRVCRNRPPRAARRGRRTRASPWR